MITIISFFLLKISCTTKELLILLKSYVSMELYIFSYSLTSNLAFISPF